MKISENFTQHGSRFNKSYQELLNRELMTLIVYVGSEGPGNLCTYTVWSGLLYRLGESFDTVEYNNFSLLRYFNNC